MTVVVQLNSMSATIILDLDLESRLYLNSKLDLESRYLSSFSDLISMSYSVLTIEIYLLV